jgi:hypothetical protein
MTDREQPPGEDAVDAVARRLQNELRPVTDALATVLAPLQDLVDRAVSAVLPDLGDPDPDEPGPDAARWPGRPQT